MTKTPPISVFIVMKEIVKPANAKKATKLCLTISKGKVPCFDFNPIPPGLFWSSWAWGGGGGGGGEGGGGVLQKPPLHKPESINAIVMKLGG